MAVRILPLNGTCKLCKKLPKIISEAEITDYFEAWFTTVPVSSVFGNSFYVAGNQRPDNGLSESSYFGIYKITTEGTLLDNYIYSNLQDTSTLVAHYNSLDQHIDGNLILCTSMNVKNHFATQQEPSYIMLYKFSPDLDIIWQRYIGGDGMYEAYAMRTTPEGGIVVTGCYSDTPPTSSTKKQLFIMQTDGNGLFTSIENEKIKSTEAILYPNPAGDIVNIEFSQVYQKATLQLLDISGKTLMEKQLNANYQSINISAIPAGTYVYRIFNKEGLDERGKVVVE